MWETSELGGEELPWAATAFNGGIAGQQQAPCGAMSASTVFLGLRHRCSLEDEKKAEQARESARKEAGKLAKDFIDTFGALSCRELIGLDFSQPEQYRQFKEARMWEEKCDHYVQFVIERLYELEGKRGTA